MYDELINLLRRCGKQKCKNCEYEHVLGCVTKMNEKAADAIEELCSLCASQSKDLSEAVAKYLEVWAKQPRWIPVTERLPPSGKDVYVTDGEYIARANLLDEVFPGDKPCWSYSGLGKITHWCKQIPLPEPPKEE